MNTSKIISMIGSCFFTTLLFVQQVHVSFGASGGLRRFQHRKLIDNAIDNSRKDVFIVKLKETKGMETAMGNGNGNGNGNGPGKQKVKDTVDELLKKNGKGGNIKHVYDSVFEGAVIDGLAAEELLIILDDEKVEYIERDGPVSVSVVQNIPASEPFMWGLDRIDQYNKTLSRTYTYNLTGTDVTAYIIDTGIYEAHQEFGNRVRCGVSYYNGVCNDAYGHGTHVAGIIGGATYGVAKNVNLVAIKALGDDGGGSFSDVVAGMDWATKESVPTKKVINLSLGAPGVYQFVNDAVQGTVNQGVVVVVAAGNAGADACYSTPSSATEAITVGSTNVNDQVSSFSNVGKCVDLFAPGENIKSAYKWDAASTATLSGTSMAAPAVTGVAVLYLQQNSSFTPNDLVKKMKNTASLNVLNMTGLIWSPNRLLNKRSL